MPDFKFIPGEPDATTADLLRELKEAIDEALDPVPLILTCPICSERHIDEGEWATRRHHSHACQNCGHVWRPAVCDTVGVQFLPGFKNDD